MFEGKKVLITGGMGMIGRELIYLLCELGAEVTAVDIKNPPGMPLGFRFIGADLRDFKNCMELCAGKDYVFHLAGIKGNPRKTENEPADFIVPMLQMNTNILEACARNEVKRVLYTSSIAVLNMGTDFYPAWAKLTGEHQIEAYRKQGFKTKFCIVRPANVYGRFDNFENPNAMVITSLISKAFGRDSTLEVWGDGSQIRDFINAKDVARGMIKAMREMPDKPVNLCSGKGITIRKIAEIIAKECNKKLQFVTSKYTGAKRRVMKPNWDFKPEIEIEEGIKEVIEWRKKQK